ncbi:MAG: hypothetical protein F4X64_09590 [Chloroflexi bacterium]|nr:hypothetical protein [Chloroflexota bacterium]
MNYRTLALCCHSRQVSRRMRRALVELRDLGGDGTGETVVGDGDGPPDGNVAALRQRVAELEDKTPSGGSWRMNRHYSWRNRTAGLPRWKMAGSRAMLPKVSALTAVIRKAMIRRTA